MPTTFNINLPSLSKKTENNLNDWSIGIVIPFQSSSHDEQTIEDLINYAVNMVQEELKKSFNKFFMSDLLFRLKSIIKKINIQMLGQSLVVMLDENDGRSMQLNFKAKPAVSLLMHHSIIDIIEQDAPEPHFFLLELDQNAVSLYEFHQNKLLRIFHADSSNENKKDLYMIISDIIERLNLKNEIPLFVSGDNNTGIKYFEARKNEVLVMRKMKDNCTENAKHISNEIVSKWEYWNKKISEKKIKTAINAGELICHLDQIITSLQKNEEGTIYFNQGNSFEYEILKKEPELNNTLNTFNTLIENFLIRGNKVEWITNKTIEKAGGIALIKNKVANSKTPYSVLAEHKSHLLEVFL